MATRGAHTYLTPEEYITFERKFISNVDTVRNEFVNGRIVPMSGSNLAHNLITGNIAMRLHEQLKSVGCNVLMNEMRVSSPHTLSYFYPDVVVVCDEPRFEDDVFDTLLNPVIIIEVLSPTTEAYDRGEKFSHYRQIDSLKEYIIVSQDKVNVERFGRTGEDWIVTYYQELEQQVPLTSIQCELPLQEIYQRVTFSE